MVQTRDGDRHLGHRVQGLGHGVQDLLRVGGQVALLGQVPGEAVDLGVRRDLLREQEPEHGLWQDLRAGLALRQPLEALLDGEAVEADAAVAVQDRGVPLHRLEPPHAADDHADRHVAQLVVRLGLDLFVELPAFGDGRGEGGLEFRGGVSDPGHL